MVSWSWFNKIKYQKANCPNNQVVMASSDKGGKARMSPKVRPPKMRYYPVAGGPPKARPANQTIVSRKPPGANPPESKQSSSDKR